ncbi:MAG: biopolymer transporter ExbD [Candidatus Goldiibacteriota bacterium HGW-Goldbacteria-1]|jgi:biopolymer transport protein TolR|nr:MAG: biopolymer transporter ExbD [Candidatus Goldiibacteriota bacterium HGW-Goldbacteria-1]
MSVDVGDDAEPITEINVTPLVDVCLVLVIIFMVTAPMMTQSKLSVTLPKAATDESKNEDHVTITIDKDGKINVNETVVYSIAQMEPVLARKLAQSDEQVVIIKADELLENGTVMDVMEAAKKAKPNKIYFATQHKKEGI